MLVRSPSDINESYQLIAYSFVPITPFRYKDWEKLDIAGDNRPNVRKSGFVSAGTVLRPTDYHEILSRGTIKDDLDKLFRQSTKQVVLVCHAPPAETNLDMTYTREHVGSRAVRDAIELYKPIVSLHGHIHESYELTSRFSEIVGESTLAFNPGHHFNRPKLNALTIELPSRKATRITVPRENAGKTFLRSVALIVYLSSDHCR